MAEPEGGQHFQVTQIFLFLRKSAWILVVLKRYGLQSILIPYYCTISNCSAWPVTRDHCAEILLRQRPVWCVILANFRRTKFSAGYAQTWVLSEYFVTASQGQCDPWLSPISALSRGPVTHDTLNNSKWYSIILKAGCETQWVVYYSKLLFTNTWLLSSFISNAYHRR